MIEYNDDSFQDADSSIIDLTLPYTGTYYAMVTSSPKSVSLKEPLTGDYELFMYTFAAGATAAYPSTTPGLGDTIYAGSGDDTIIAGSADDTIADPPPDTIVYGSGTVNMLQADTSLSVSAGTNQSVNEGTAITLTGSFLDTSGDTNPIFDWHVVAASGQLDRRRDRHQLHVHAGQRRKLYGDSHGDRSQRRLGLGRRRRSRRKTSHRS